MIFGHLALSQLFHVCVWLKWCIFNKHFISEMFSLEMFFCNAHVFSVFSAGEKKNCLHATTKHLSSVFSVLNHMNKHVIPLPHFHCWGLTSGQHYQNGQMLTEHNSEVSQLLRGYEETLTINFVAGRYKTLKSNFVTFDRILEQMPLYDYFVKIIFHLH